MGFITPPGLRNKRSLKQRWRNFMSKERNWTVRWLIVIAVGVWYPHIIDIMRGIITLLP